MFFYCITDVHTTLLTCNSREVVLKKECEWLNSSVLPLCVTVFCIIDIYTCNIHVHDIYMYIHVHVHICTCTLCVYIVLTVLSIIDIYTCTYIHVYDMYMYILC